MWIIPSPIPPTQPHRILDAVPRKACFKALCLNWVQFHMELLTVAESIPFVSFQNPVAHL